MSDLEGYDPFVYRAHCERVVDGDTLEFTLDMGFHLTQFEDIRLAGVDTREIHGVSKDSEEYIRGDLHRQYVEEWVKEATLAWSEDQWPFFVDTEYDREGKFGRVLGDVYARAHPDQPLSEALLEEFDDVDEVDY